MHISSFSLRNYRNFRNSVFRFNKGINTIIGENGSGKTNVFQALRLLIDDSIPRSARLLENDFNRKLKRWEGHWIALSVEFDELDADEEIRYLAVHAVGELDNCSCLGRYSLYFRPKFEWRKKLFDYAKNPEKNKAGLSKLLKQITISDYELVYRAKGQLWFNDDEMYNKHVGNFEAITFPDPEDACEDIYGVRLPGDTSIPLIVSCTFVKALRDVESDLKSHNKSPLIKLLKGQEKKISREEVLEIEAKVLELNSKISSIDEVRQINEGVERSIQGAVGSTYAPNLEIKSELPNEINRLFQSLKLWVGDPDEDGYKGRLWELSLGGTNLIYLSLKLLEYERVRSLDRAANFLLIEEPEAHIHTHIQKTLFKKLQNKNTQVIVSTHSTHISSVSKISSVNVISRRNSESLVYDPSCGLEKSEIIHLERYLDAVRSDLLFAKGVILVEGDAEQLLIPELFHKVFGHTFDEVGVSLINIGSTGFENVARVFHENRIQKRCSIITDLDKSIYYLPQDIKQAEEKIKKSYKSQESGKARQARLIKFSEKNKFISLFFATHTFEVDFLKAGNVSEVEMAIESINKRSKTIQDKKKKVQSQDLESYGEAILNLANDFGKGWFALLIADFVSYETKIPDYVLEAIAFSAPHVDNKFFTASANYRLSRMDQSEVIQVENLKDSPDDFLCQYASLFPDDNLTKFMSFFNAV